MVDPVTLAATPTRIVSPYRLDPPASEAVVPDRFDASSVTTDSPAADTTQVHRGWRVAALAALSLVPVLGLVGCSSPPPEPATVCQSAPIKSERVATSEPLEILDHFSREGTRCSKEPGVFADRGWLGEKKLKPGQALERLQKGEKLHVKDSNGKPIVIASIDDLQEADALIGRGRNTILSPTAYQALRELESPQQGNAYEALNRLQAGQSIAVGNQGFVASSTDDVVIYHGMFGNGQETFLNADQLKSLYDLYGKSGGSYEAAKAFHRGQPAYYSFAGGDFGDTLGVSIPKADDLPDAIRMVRNQQEFDRYRLSAQEFRSRLTSEASRTPDLARRALSDAESDYSSARAMPETVQESYSDTEYGYHYGLNPMNGEFEYHYGPQTVTKYRDVENQERTRKMREARSRIDAAEDVKRLLPDLQDAVASGKDLDGLASVLERMRYRAEDSSLRDNLQRLQSLVHGQQTRPERPAGWVAPSPRVQG